MGSRLQCNMDYKYYSGFRKRKRHGNLLHGGKHRRETNRNYCHLRKNLYSDASGSPYFFSHAILPGGRRRVKKEEICQWTVVSNGEWITNITPASGRGSATVTYSLAKNNTDAIR